MFLPLTGHRLGARFPSLALEDTNTEIWMGPKMNVQMSVTSLAAWQLG